MDETERRRIVADMLYLKTLRPDMSMNMMAKRYGIGTALLKRWAMKYENEVYETLFKGGI